MSASERDQKLVFDLIAKTGRKASALAVDAGVSPSTLLKVMQGQHRLSIGTIEKLQATFPDAFGDIDDVGEGEPSSYVEVEVLPSFAGAGGGGYGEGEPGRALLPRQLIEERLRGRPQDFLLIEVRGDSMTLAGYLHGDQILVDRRDKDPTQPGPFALFDGDTYVVKLVERVPLKRGWFRIFSASDRGYTPYEIEEAQARVVGRPVWLGRAL